MHIDIPRAQLLIEERDTMETVGTHTDPFLPLTNNKQLFLVIQEMNLVMEILSFCFVAVPQTTGPLCY